MLLQKIKRIYQKHSRNDKDTSQDVLLLLYLIKKCGGSISDKDNFSAQVKLMKLVFLAEYEMSITKNIKGFNFFFNVYKKGPSSRELLKMLDYLIERGLVVKKAKAFSLGKDGEITINDFVSSDRENKNVFKIIDDMIKQYGKLSTADLLDRVYSMNIKPMYSDAEINIGKEVEISGGKPGKRLLMRLDDTDAKKELLVSPEWVETVNILLNPAFSR